MLRRSAAVVLAVVLAPAAHANGPGGGVCGTGDVLVTVCAADNSGSSGSSGSSGGKPAAAALAASGGDSKPTDKCSYDRVDPPPSAGHQAWRGHDPADGSVYKVVCDSARGGVVFLPNGEEGPGAPTIDPELVARRAAASMRLEPPKVASPRAVGTYVVGIPMWMWATPSPSTFGPVSAFATAGGVTVTATARVTSVRWAMGDGATVTCHGPGTPYRKSQEVTSSPDCGHLYERPSYEQPGGRFKGTATATWTVTWTAPALGDGGQLTETRATEFTAAVREVEVVNSR
ncbi:ATP/GTP-binding protein [Streptomyces sp. NBC_01212]|uniref:ATP/GTP-binding protein n=1 Tax=Streptomyces sp. NBC_01212 TaxID=2903775 RepID=UPI002E0F129B|nr:ATP/GTP-binding protein [Streptomyces sp. NBC_01212]WSQ89491.1 ATP/GTP-binding protein [Streptomyces sp. NBC_01212]